MVPVFQENKLQCYAISSNSNYLPFHTHRLSLFDEGMGEKQGLLNLEDVQTFLNFPFAELIKSKRIYLCVGIRV